VACSQFSQLSEEFNRVTSSQHQQLATRGDVTELRAGVQVSSHHQCHPAALCLLVKHVTRNTLLHAVIGAPRPRQHLVIMATHTCVHGASIATDQTFGLITPDKLWSTFDKNFLGRRH